MSRKLTVGQELYFVPQSRHGSPRPVTVTKVGRKWAYIGEHERIHVETLALDSGGYSARGYCYLSKEEYEQQLRLETAWTELRELFTRRYAPPFGVTVNQIENAKRSLFKDAP